MDKASQDRLAKVHPELAKRVANLIAALAEHGIDARVVSGLRTYAEQDALYAQGRTHPGQRVTNARGGYSNHNFGLACDIGIFDAKGKYLGDSMLYDLIQPAAHQAGLESGADWKHINDRPHVQLPTDLIVKGSPTNACRALYAKGGLPAIFEHVTRNLSAVVQPPTLPVTSDEASSKGSLTNKQPPILRKGSTGPEVTRLQQELRKRGYTLEISGTFDDRTAVVLRRFQASSGIDVDGECGKQVRRALGI